MRMFVGDEELIGTYKLNNKHTIGISADYDFNITIDPKPSKDSTHFGENSGQMFSTGRYFWGNGPAFRFFLDNTYYGKNGSQKFVSLELLWKTRNYKNHIYIDDQQGIWFLESGNQNIYGFSIYFGRNYVLSKSLVRLYWGFGLRILDSDIYRPAYIIEGQHKQSSTFNEVSYFPVLHFGFACLVKMEKSSFNDEDKY